MSKFVIEPNKIYDVDDGSNVFFIRVLERWYSDFKFEPAFYTRFELKHLFGSFDFNDSESDEEDIDDEEA